MGCDVGFYFMGPATGSVCSATSGNAVWLTLDPGCAACGTAATTAGASSASISSCGCRPGYYIAGTNPNGPGIDCQACPLGTWKGSSPGVGGDTLTSPKPCLSCGDHTTSFDTGAGGGAMQVSDCLCQPGFGFDGISQDGNSIECN
eukprot:gene9416-8435_t